MSDVTRLLGVPEGVAALKLLAPLVEELADYIAGRRDEPPAALAQVPGIDAADLALERARIRAAQP